MVRHDHPDLHADPKQPLPFATRYEVTVDASATAVSGRKLASPTLHVHDADGEAAAHECLPPRRTRRARRSSSCCASIRRSSRPGCRDICRAVPAARMERRRRMSADAEQRLAAIDQTSLSRFDAKVKAAACRGDRRNGPVALRLTNDWDKKRYPPAKDLVVARDGHARSRRRAGSTSRSSEALPSPAGPATPGSRPTVHRPGRAAILRPSASSVAPACDPDDRQPDDICADASKVDRFAKALSVVTDIIDGRRQGQSRPRSPAAHREDATTGLTLEDGGFKPQPPATTYVATIDPACGRSTVRRLATPGPATVENWHRTAFTSFGDGHGVWEASGGVVLPFYAQQPLPRESVGGAAQGATI